MALMNFREPNQVKWLGSRPGHNGTQITEFNVVDNGNVDLYVVPAGKRFFLTSWAVSAINISGGAGNGFMSVAIGGLNAFMPASFSSALNEPMSEAGRFWPPIELAAAENVYIYSSVAAFFIRGSIHGWVE